MLYHIIPDFLKEFAICCNACVLAELDFQGGGGGRQLSLGWPTIIYYTKCPMDRPV